MTDGNGLVPVSKTARGLAAETGWTEARAKHVLNGLVERGLAELDADDTYRITGLGLGIGERMGVVKPLDVNAGGYIIP